MALGNTQGSCLPFACKICLFLSKSYVFWFFPIVDTGLIATLKNTFSPVVIPPKVPPALFDEVFSSILTIESGSLLNKAFSEKTIFFRFLFGMNKSLCCDPLFEVKN